MFPVIMGVDPSFAIPEPAFPVMRFPLMTGDTARLEIPLRFSIMVFSVMVTGP